MPLSWIKRLKQSSVDELIAAGKYGKAIDLMRRQFSQRYPSTTERQGYAELLVRAGRGAEAVPVLLGIADEQERYGCPDKALEALRCAAAIDPEQAEVKERLESVRDAPPEAPAADPSAPPEGPSAPDRLGPTLDAAPAPRAGAPESASVEEEVFGLFEAEAPQGVAPDGESGFAVLDAEEPNPMDHDGGQENHADEAASAAPPGDEQDLVVVEEAGEVTATSPRVVPTVPGPEEPGPATADDGEITAESIHVDPSVLEAEEPEPVAADGDEGEITAESIHVDPSVLEAEEPGPVAADGDDGEITAESIHVDPSVLEAEEPGPVAADGDDGEITAESIHVDPSVLGAEEPEPVAEDDENTAPSIRVEPGDEPDAGTQHLLPPEDDLEPEEVEELTAEAGPELGARTADAGAPPPEGTPGADDGLHSLLTDQDLEEALTAEAHALLADGPAEDESGSLEDDDRLDLLLTTDAQALLADHPRSDAPGALDDDGQLDELLATDARALLADGPTRDGPAPVGERPESPASGTDSGDGPADEAEDPLPGPHPDETHLFLSEDDLLGALIAGPEPSSTPNESEDEVDRLVLALAEAGASGTALRSLPPETADPLQVAVALRARYGSCDWSARVRLHLSGLMLEAGRADDALDTLTGVAEDLAQQGHGRGAIAILKRAGRLRHRGSNGAIENDALREGAEALLSEAAELAAGPSPAVEEEAEAAGQEQGHQLAG